MDSRPSPDLAALETDAAARLAEARQQHAEAISRQPAVDRTHAVTQQLRQRNRWGAMIEDVMGGR